MPEKNNCSNAVIFLLVNEGNELQFSLKSISVSTFYFLPVVITNTGFSIIRHVFAFLIF